MTELEQLRGLLRMAEELVERMESPKIQRNGIVDDSFLGDHVRRIQAEETLTARAEARYPLDENEREFATCAVCDRKSIDRGECLRMHGREHAVIGPPPHWFFAHTPKGIGHVFICSEACASFYLDTVCAPDTRTAPESPCTCAEIQRKDPLRHFRECPLREDLPPGHPQAERDCNCFHAPDRHNEDCSLREGKLKHHYSGDNSQEFWDRVNALPEKEKDTLYACGVLLQELEVKVLRWLGQAEDL